MKCLNNNHYSVWSPLQFKTSWIPQGIKSKYVYGALVSVAQSISCWSLQFNWEFPSCMHFVQCWTPQLQKVLPHIHSIHYLNHIGLCTGRTIIHGICWPNTWPPLYSIWPFVFHVQEERQNTKCTNNFLFPLTVLWSHLWRSINIIFSANSHSQVLTIPSERLCNPAIWLYLLPTLIILDHQHQLCLKKQQLASSNTISGYIIYYTVVLWQ